MGSDGVTFFEAVLKDMGNRTVMVCEKINYDHADICEI